MGRRSARRVAALVAGALAASLIVAAGCAPRAMSTMPDAATRIRYYHARVREHPRHYPSHAHLGSAYLDQARETLDPSALVKARAALARSLELQSNFEAMKAMTALSNFTHRFEDAVAWGEHAAEAWPVDTEVTALLVEAHLGLGDREKAAALIGAERSEPSADFHIAASRGRWLAESSRPAEAVVAFVRAADLARAAGIEELAAWAQVSAAAAWIDAGEPERAAPHLDEASRLRPGDRRLRLHRAEMLEGRGDHAGALEIYLALVAAADDPEVHRRAALVARRFGRTGDAEAHFRAAEAGFGRALGAGEIYTLEGLARLYADHRRHLTEAVALSARNLAFKRDRGAVATDAYVRAALAD